MTRATLKLESFVSTGMGASYPAQFNQLQIDAAYHDGYAAGHLSGQRADATAIVVAMRDLAATMGDDEQRLGALRQSVVTALAPLLSEILDAVAPAAASRRLEEALTTELRRLAEITPPLQCKIACPASQREMIHRCAKEAGLPDCVFTEIPPADGITLSLQGGQICFSPERTVRELRTIIADILEESPK